MAGLHFDITADNKNFIKALNEITVGVNNATNQIEQDGVQIEEFFNRIRNISAISFAGFGIGEMLNKITTTRAYFQDIESSMKVFLGDAEKAAAFTEELQDAAYYNMYDFAQLADASKQLIAYGNDVEDVTDIIYKLSEVGQATGQQLGEMVSLYNKAKSTGVVGSEQIDSWAAKGLILKDVMKEMGTYVQGQTITFNQLNEVLDKVTSEGGMFHGIQDSMMENINSNIGQLEDQLSLMFNDIGKEIEEPINWVLKKTSEMMDHWKEIGYTIASIMVSVGTQKGIDLVTDTIDKTAVQAMYAKEQAQLQALLPNKEKEEKTSLQQAVAAGHLSEAKAAEIEQLRKEVHAHLESLAIKEKEAIAEKKLADANVDALTSWKKELDNEIEKTKEHIDFLKDSADMSEYQTEVEKLNTLEKERNSVATELNTAAEKQNTAATNLGAISAEKEAIARGLETTSTTNSTFATRVLTTAKTLLIKAQTKLNAVIAANQYAIALAAIMALAYGVHYLCTYESEATKRANELNEANEQVSASYEEEDKKLGKLFGKLKDAKKGSDEWKAAKDAIVSQYGQYFSNLDTEIEKTQNLNDVYKQLTKSVRDSIAARGLADFHKKIDKSSDRMSEWNDFAEEFRKNSKLDESSMKFVLPIVEEYVKNGEETLDDVLKHIEYSLTDKYGSTGTSLYGAIESRLKDFNFSKARELHKQSRDEADQLKTFQRNNGLSDDLVNEVLYGIKPAKEYSDNRSDKEKIKAKLDGLIKQYDNLRKSNQEETQKAKDLLAEIKEKETELKDFHDYKSESKKKSGPSASQLVAKEENAAGKLADVIRKQGQERLRLEQDYEYERWQSRVDLMEEGEAKVLAQQELDFAKERTSLERRKDQDIEAELQRQMALFDAQENVKAGSNKKYSKKTFRDSDISRKEFDEIEERYKSLLGDLESQQKKAESDRLDAARESMNAYLKEFGSYQEKRLAIQEEYETKISEAQNEGERMQFIANRNKALADLDFNEWQDNGGMALAFGDIENLSKDTISQLISDMEKYRSKIIATFDPEKIRTFEDALNNLRKAESSDDFFGDNEILSSIQQRLSVQKQLADEEAKEIELKRQKAGLEIQLSALQMGRSSIILGYTPEGEEIKSEPAISEDELRRAEELRVKLDAANRALETSAKNSRQLKSQLDKLGKIKFADIQKFSNNLLKAGKNASSLASIFSDDLADAIQSGSEKLEVMFDAFTELSSNIEVLAKAGKNAVKDTVDASKGIVEGASSGMQASAAATATSLSTMEKASAILAIIGAAIQLATMVASLFNTDKRHEKNIEKLQDQIDRLQSSYDKLGKAADKAFSTDASALIEQQETLLRQQQALIKQQYVEEFNKKKTDTDKLKEYSEKIKEIDDLIADNKQKAKEAIIGEDLKSAINEFASLYAEAWNDGTDAAQKSMAAVKNIISSALSELLKKNIQPAATKFYDYLAEALERGLTDSDLDILDSYKKQMDAAVAKYEEQYKMIQERYRDLDEIKEDLTDISFDSVRDNFKSKLADMTSDAASFTDDFSDMLRNALIDGLMDTKYDNMLKEWYDEFAEKMDDRKLTDEERDVLRQKYDAIVQQGLEDRDFINSIVGGGAYSQEASKGGWETIGQDQADELNGRFTALTELEAINNTLVSEGNVIAMQILDTLRSFSSLTMVTDGENPTLREMRDMMFLSTGHLEDISKYTKHLITIHEGIDKLNDLINQRL